MLIEDRAPRYACMLTGIVDVELPPRRHDFQDEIRLQLPLPDLPPGRVVRPSRWIPFVSLADAGTDRQVFIRRFGPLSPAIASNWVTIFVEIEAEAGTTACRLTYQISLVGTYLEPAPAL